MKTASAEAPAPSRLHRDLDKPINDFGALIDALSELGLELEDELLTIDLRFPLLSDLRAERTPQGVAITGF